MTVELYVKLLEHNNWANDRMIVACGALTDLQLDAEPHSATKGNIRATLIHLVHAQRAYLRHLTLPPEERTPFETSYGDLGENARESGEGLLALVRAGGVALDGRFETRDGYEIDNWVVLVQAINHATEHREQISSMLTALGVSPPELDGWSYGEYAGAVVQR